MKDDIKKAIERLTGMVTDGMDSADALRYTQAALNLAHVQATITNTEQQEKE